MEEDGVPSPSDIQTLCQLIAARIRPAKIILFGSHAWGTPTTDSDVDLLIVARLRGSPARTAAALRTSLRPAFPVDLLVRTPDMVRRRLAMDDPFIARILREGKTLYEAAR